MAIVLKYGAPGPILQAGFAAGVGHRKNVQTEDNLKIWQQQQYQDFHANQSALQRQQTAALQQQHQNFQADQNAENRYNDVLRLRAQTAYQDKTLAQQQAHYDELKHQGTLDDLASGKKVLPGSAENRLKELEQGRVLMQGPGYNEAQRAQFDKDYEIEYRKIIGTAVPNRNTPSSAINKQLVHVDQHDRVFDKPQVDPETGLKTTTAYLGGNPLVDHSKEQAAQAKAAEAAQKQQKEAAEAAQKAEEKFQADENKWLEKRHATALRIQKDKTPANSETKPPLDFDAAEKEMEAAGFTRPQRQAPQQPQQLPVTANQPDFSKDNAPVQEAQPNGTFSGLPPVNQQPFTGSTAGGPGTYGQPVPAASQYTPEARQAILGGSQLPRPSSKEEADSLGPGASWVAPDGTIRRNP